MLAGPGRFLVGTLLLAIAPAAVGRAADDAPGAVRVRDDRLVLTRFAADPAIVTPVGLTVDPLGRVLVVESHTHFRPKDYAGPPADRLRLFEDRDGDGVAERVSTFWEGSKFTMAVAFHPITGTLYVATRYQVFRLDDLNHDGRADGPPIAVATLETDGNYPHNGLSGFAFDPAGHVYFGLGENLGARYTLVGTDGTRLSGGGEGGNVYRCDPDGKNLQRLATGFWNPFAMTIDVYGRLFVVDNDPDSRPPCRLLQVVPAGDYGYRFRNGRKGLHPFTAWNGELPGTLPMAAGTGEAPSGVIVYESDGLPDDYRGRILSTSWGDHRIEMSPPVALKSASYQTTLAPLITGGEDFRPVGMAVAPDGSVYISDWVDKSYDLHGKGRVWKLRGRDLPARPAPAGDRDALTHPDRPTREAAARRLAATSRATLREVLGASETVRARATALDALTIEPTADDEPALKGALLDPSPDLRALAVRRLPDRLLSAPALATRDPATEVRAEALRRIATPDGRPAVLDALSDADPFVRQAARAALGRIEPEGDLVELSHHGVEPEVRLGALLVLRDRDTATARAAVAPALGDGDPAVRFVAIQWVAESGLTAHRAAVEATLAAPGTTPALFGAALAALERLDGTNRGPRDEQGGEEYAARLLAGGASDAVARRALRMVRPDHPLLTVARLDRWLASPDSALRVEAVRTLRDGNLPDRFDRLAALARDAGQPVNLRAEAVVGLAPRSAEPGVKRLLLDLAAGSEATLRDEALRSLRGAGLSNPERTQLDAAVGRDPAARALVGALDTAAASSGRNPALADWLARLDGPADAAAGSRVFFHPNGPGCYRCHQVDGRGGRIGPELSTTGGALTRERLVESILAPSKEVAPQFVAWSVALNDGRVLVGTRVAETLEGTVYGDAQGHLTTVKSADVAEAKPRDESIMPADLARLMTDQEFRDLLAFLRGTPAPR